MGAGRIPERNLELGKLRRCIGNRPGACQRLGHGGAALHLANVLAEMSDADPPVDDDLAFVEVLLAHDQPKQRGLARAVRPHEADLLAAMHERRGLEKEDLLAVALADRIKADQCKASVTTPQRFRCGAATV